MELNKIRDMNVCGSKEFVGERNIPVADALCP